MTPDPNTRKWQAAKQAIQAAQQTARQVNEKSARSLCPFCRAGENHEADIHDYYIRAAERLAEEGKP